VTAIFKAILHLAIVCLAANLIGKYAGWDQGDITNFMLGYFVTNLLIHKYKAKPCC
jgi:hypothetical protein